ncbi:pantoate--beta-alanine ligase [Methylomicrobium sp. Wu6]|uniref:pantoate--beta-alanine ligase n=1 Tax=Methylomicrobium sp. Wu6 TaxID=3107928 RepID=UPI002DD69B1C|nr:pantoate--beta-alanine ligase [Methylomicrobium sp. Wu6]MEC4748043.1 pantoate--beta-alanine ligase [Methylomicrobium sp. Wu6]
MQTVNTIAELRAVLASWRRAGDRIAFVPTMGNLHEGHISLVDAARQRTERVVVSIFVNPTQFGVGEDFETYPRTEAEDREKLLAAGADLLFLPAVREMYDPAAKTVVSVAGLSDLHCGAFRPGHFNGVATVVAKLFNIVQPDKALFGLKDYQQFVIIRTMVRDLNMQVELVPVETVREVNGLAMSSRNGYLSSAEKENAAKLYRALCEARDAVLSGDADYGDIERQAQVFLSAAGFKVDYFSICRSTDLVAAMPEDRGVVILVAARLGKTRLIDNICFSK